MQEYDIRSGLQMLWTIERQQGRKIKEDDYIEQHMLVIYQRGDGRYDSDVALHYLNELRGL